MNRLNADNSFVLSIRDRVLQFGSDVLGVRLPSNIFPNDNISAASARPIFRELESESQWDSWITTDSPILFYFYAEWCEPCHIQFQQLQKLSWPSLQVVRVDVDTFVDLAERLKVETIPTVMGYQNGAQIFNLSGIRPATELQRLLTAEHEPPQCQRADEHWHFPSSQSVEAAC